jgi:hypothetical protein
MPCKENKSFEAFDDDPSCGNNFGISLKNPFQSAH